jgi:hypothetical protein
VIKRLAALSRRLYEDRKVVLGFLLAYVLAQPLRPKAQLDLLFVVARGVRRYDPLFSHRQPQLLNRKFIGESLAQAVGRRESITMIRARRL